MKTNWDHYSSVYKRIVGNYTHDVAELNKHILDGASFFEVGVGDGRVASMFAPTSSRYLGVDISSGMLGLMPEISGLEIEHVDFMHFFTEELFDYVLLPYRVIHYLYTWQEALGRAVKLLNHKGFLFIDLAIDAVGIQTIKYNGESIVRFRQVIKISEIITEIVSKHHLVIIEKIRRPDQSIGLWFQKP